MKLISSRHAIKISWKQSSAEPYLWIIFNFTQLFKEIILLEIIFNYLGIVSSVLKRYSILM